MASRSDGLQGFRGNRFGHFALLGKRQCVGCGNDPAGRLHGPLHPHGKVGNDGWINGQLPVGKMLDEDILENRIIGRLYRCERQGAQTRAQIGQRNFDVAGRGRAGQQRKGTTLTRCIQNVKQEPLVRNSTIDVLDGKPTARFKLLESCFGKVSGFKAARVRARLPDFDEMRFAGARRS
jgi:hypothetical protein